MSAITAPFDAQYAARLQQPDQTGNRAHVQNAAPTRLDHARNQVLCRSRERATHVDGKDIVEDTIGVSGADVVEPIPATLKSRLTGPPAVAELAIAATSPSSLTSSFTSVRPTQIQSGSTVAG